jgi:hypothetical protein
LVLRNSHYATKFTKTARTIQAMPRQRFLFYANFNPGSATRIRDMSSYTKGFAFQIGKIDRPRATPEVKELHQYNRKRLVQTGIKFDPLSITFHDTVDDRVLRVWNQYYQWYFGEGRNAGKKSTAWKSSVISNSFDISSGWGFSPPNATDSDTGFFESLDIYVFYGKFFTQTRVFNPKITMMEFENLDSESSALSNATMTVAHEGMEYRQVGGRIGPTEISLFGLNQGDYFEPSDLFGGVNAFLLGVSDEIQENIDNLLNNVSSIPFVGSALAGAGANLIKASGIAGFPTKIATQLSSGGLARFGRFF